MAPLSSVVLTLALFNSLTVVSQASPLHNVQFLELDEDDLSDLSALAEYGDAPVAKGAHTKGGAVKGGAVKGGKKVEEASPFAPYDDHNPYNPYGGLKPATPAGQNSTVHNTTSKPVATGLICPSHCSSNGYCKAGNCFCKQGFSGSDCAKPTCANDCNGNGHCVLGQCRCFAGWSGFDCSYRGCQDQCNHRGYCHIGPDRSVCICYPGFNGTTCAIGPACGWGENGEICSGNGECVNKKCFCKPGYTGADCAQVICPSGGESKSMCSGFGVCNTETGTCECEYPHFGLACENAKCPGDCSGNGECNRYGRCECKPGFFGKDCSPKNCPDDCNGHGKCEYKVHKNGQGKTAQCKCHSGWGPEKDGKPNSCSAKICEPGRVGKNCEKRVCIDNCHEDKGHGVCDTSTFSCTCKEGWSGVSCQFKSCPDLCNHHGTCNDGVCNCKDDWTGDTCAIPPKKCPNSCSNHGKCFHGKCYCDDGWSGKDCRKSSNVDFPVGRPETPYQGIVCIPSCSANGVCMTRDGTNECFCKDGWSGLSCETYVHTPGNLRSLDGGRSKGPAFMEVSNGVATRLARKTKPSKQNVL